jgi:hypothetical protein
MIDFLRVRLAKCRLCPEPCEIRGKLDVLSEPASRCPRAGKAPHAQTWFPIRTTGAPEQPRPAQPKREKRPRKEWGPPMWETLHRWALQPPGDAQERREWLRNFSGLIPVCPCHSIWLQMLRKTPPPADPALLFGWTVDRHNEVNEATGKPLVSLEEALEIWGEGAV